MRGDLAPPSDLTFSSHGILVGDGRMNYRTEDIFETYHAWAIQKELVATFDYQFVANVAHDADRSPVPIFSARVHAEW